MVARRHFINGAQSLNITVGVNASAVTLTVTTTSGYPPSTPFTLALERGTVNEEVVLCTAFSGTTFTVTRGWDGSTAKSHLLGVILEHTTSAEDYDEANAHISDVSRDDHTQYAGKALWVHKGALAVATADATPANLTVGADNMALVADAAQATGVKWALITSAMIADATIVLADLAASLAQKVIQVAASTAAFGPGAAGEVIHTTGDTRWNGYTGAAWTPIATGIGKVTISNGAPSGGVAGDVWLRY